jgi:hypothetical protein
VTGIFLPFGVPVDARNFPRVAFRILMAISGDDGR